jgi:replicative DNA helicase
VTASLEKALLGALLLDGGTCDLSPHHFASDSHRQIYAAIQAGAGDVVQVCHALGGKLESVGGTGYVWSLTELVPRSLPIAKYAALIREEWKRTELEKAAMEVLTRLEDGATFTEAAVALRQTMRRIKAEQPIGTGLEISTEEK